MKMVAKENLTMWRTADGHEINIKDMELSHLRNSIAKIRRSWRSVNGKAIAWRGRWLQALVAELERRGKEDSKDLNPSRVTNRFRNLDLN